MGKLFVVVLLVSVALPAFASDDVAVAEAQQLANAAGTAWENGDYLTALARFEAAHARFPSVNLRFNIARVLTDLGRDVEAIAAFEDFLREATQAPESARNVAAAKIEVLKQRIGTLALSCANGDAVVRVDGKLYGACAQVGTIRCAPGTHQISAETAGFVPFLASVTAEPGKTATVVVKLVPLQAAKKPLVKRWWFWTAIGGAAAVAATGIALGVVYGRNPPNAEAGVAMPSTSAGLTR